MERAFRDLRLTHSEIERVCRKHFKEKGALQEVETLSGGAVNTTFKIRWDDEWYILRFYLREPMTLSVEKEIYSKLRGSVSIPEMLFVSPPNEEPPFVIFRFCAKPHLYEVSAAHSDRLSYDLGRTLANIHRFRFPKAGLFGEKLSIQTPFEEGTSPYFEYCLAHLTPGSNAWKRLGIRAAWVLRAIKERREFFPMVGDGGCLVHSDFKPVNLLWNEENGVTVLDWEFAHSGDGIMDFGILLRHFQEFPLNITSLSQGYKEGGGTLVSDWIQRARMTDFVNIIQLLNTPSDRPKLAHQLIQSVDLTLEHWENFSNIF